MKTVAVEHCSDAQSQVVKIEWNLGKRCNFNCSYCDEFTHDNKSPHMSFEVAKRTIDKIVSKLPNKRFKMNLTGGEPTNNPEIEKIIDYMYEKGCMIGLTTNGSRKYEFYEKLLPKLDSLIFSYHMEYHKREVIPDNLVKLFQLAQTFEKHIHMHVHMMMLPSTFDEAKEAIAYFKENDIPVVMRRIRPAYKKDNDAVFNDKGQLTAGNIAEPFYDGVVTLKFNNGQADYTGGTDYYSKDEIDYLENNNV